MYPLKLENHFHPTKKPTWWVNSSLSKIYKTIPNLIQDNLQLVALKSFAIQKLFAD